MTAIERGELPPPCTLQLLALLKEAEPATIGHFHDRGFLHGRIKAMTAVARSVGTAVTVRCEGSDGSILHHALGQLRVGDFLFVDRAGDETIACMGGASMLAARLRGVAGVVVDGCVTDIAELRELGVPVWARGLSARTTRAGGQSGSFCRPVDCGGVRVHPGDAVLADENGVLVMPPDEAWALARKAIGLQQAEQQTLARLRAGESYSDVLDTRLVFQEAAA
ncbi:RraA family protein [Variovorax paradoxus]|uniref:Putative 4-hydroxy-4-methyl-2-oxoglutarate aldolase n=1 Tax=Variovorax paradoxus TaxID=34073 RepID=A0A0H2LXP0_VARPD|nr:RraA family protein [Variovorax paradoxus]KLN54501.1 4-hydroxy-4-methyl-2-oxoglutarate aldolase [Variovorax paradoxus]